MKNVQKAKVAALKGLAASVMVIVAGGGLAALISFGLWLGVSVARMIGDPAGAPIGVLLFAAYVVGVVVAAGEFFIRDEEPQDD